MRLFYCPNIKNDQFLNEEESHHAVKVLRLKSGDNIEILDGKGTSYVAIILEENQKKCTVEIISHSQHIPRPYFVEILVSPTKSADRIEWFVEKAIEIGVDKITLIETSRTERKKVRLDRLQKIAISAMKQSKTFHLPDISEMVSFASVVSDKFDGQRYIAHCIEEEKLHIKNQLKPKSRCQILIGPEGDFTENEIALALKNEFEPVTLGDNRLRTETAALYACMAVNVINA